MVTWLSRLHWRWKLAAALSVVLVVLAIGTTLLRGRSNGSDPRRLMAVLSVLHRPHGSQDELPPWAAAEVRSVTGPGQAWVPGLTRFVAAVPYTTGPVRAAHDVERIFLTVFTPGTAVKPIDRPFTDNGDVIGVTQLIPGHGGAFGPYVPASMLAYPPVALPRVSDGYEVSVVPNGVARVRWSFGGSLPVSATVRDNVAMAPVNLDLAQPTSATWYGRGGQVLKTILLPRVFVLPPLPALTSTP